MQTLQNNGKFKKKTLKNTFNNTKKHPKNIKNTQNRSNEIVQSVYISDRFGCGINP